MLSSSATTMDTASSRDLAFDIRTSPARPPTIAGSIGAWSPGSGALTVTFA